jgi:hypothetical protein
MIIRFKAQNYITQHQRGRRGWTNAYGVSTFVRADPLSPVSHINLKPYPDAKIRKNYQLYCHSSTKFSANSLRLRQWIKGRMRK